MNEITKRIFRQAATDTLFFTKRFQMQSHKQLPGSRENSTCFWTHSQVRCRRAAPAPCLASCACDGRATPGQSVNGSSGVYQSHKRLFRCISRNSRSRTHGGNSTFTKPTHTVGPRATNRYLKTSRRYNQPWLDPGITFVHLLVPPQYRESACLTNYFLFPNVSTCLTPKCIDLSHAPYAPSSKRPNASDYHVHISAIRVPPNVYPSHITVFEHPNMLQGPISAIPSASIRVTSPYPLFRVPLHFNARIITPINACRNVPGALNPNIRVLQ